MLGETNKGVTLLVLPWLTMRAGSANTHASQLRSFTARLTAIAATAERPAAAGRAAQDVVSPAMPWLVLLNGSANTPVYQLSSLTARLTAKAAAAGPPAAANRTLFLSRSARKD